jgi:hypothetical protein
LVKSPEEWIYSSYKEFIGQRKGTLPKPEIVLSQFITSEASNASDVTRLYREFVNAKGVNEPKNLSDLLFD